MELRSKARRLRESGAKLRASGELGADVKVYLNNKISLDQIAELGPEKIVISPGPCTPKEAGISCAVIRHFSARIPTLGVCLGHQAIGAAFGGEIVRAPAIMHGIETELHHQSLQLFAMRPLVGRQLRPAP